MSISVLARGQRHPSDSCALVPLPDQLDPPAWTRLYAVAMVFFVCEVCQESIKKNKVQNHCNNCRDCWVLTCVDCGVSFQGDEYKSHATCISEAEKYQGALYRAPKQKVKRNPQAEWMAALGRAAADPSASSDVKSVLNRLEGNDNVPRKAAKFRNFAANSLQMRGYETLLDRTFEFIMSHWPKPAPKPAQPKAAAADSGASAGETSAGAGGAPKAAKKEKKEKKDKKEKKEKKDKKRSRESDDSASGVAAPAAATPSKKVGSAIWMPMFHSPHVGGWFVQQWRSRLEHSV